MTDCPNEPTLERFLAGALVPSETTDVDTHVSACEHCGRWLAEARADEQLLPALRGVADQVAATAMAPPAHIGGYKILREIGAGGMGVVYEAEQDNPRRSVALKIVRPGLVSARTLRRFEHEAQVLGRLHHPGIAQIHEAGTFESPQGPQPWFAMELVAGKPLLDWVRDNAADRAARLRLFAGTCLAVHHAHQKGVIHRDLKPGNILVDVHGQPKVLDFGVSRLVDDEGTSTTLRTKAGQLIGTLNYMSPEQVSGDPDNVDTRSDVYALGVILYQLLSGRLPQKLDKVSVPEAVRRIAEEEPPNLGHVDRTLRGDLATIVQKALQKDRDRRYASAAELAAEIERFLSQQPITARPPSTIYQLGKFARRNKVAVAAAATLTLVLIAGIITTLILLDQAREAAAVAQEKQEEAEQETEQAEAAREFLQETLVLASPNEQNGREPTLREALNKALERIDRIDKPHVEASVRHTLGRVLAGLGRLDEAEEHLRRSLQLYEEIYNRQHKKVAYVLTSLSNLHFQQSRHKDAEDTARRALSMRSALKLPQHAIILGTALLNVGKAEYVKTEFAASEQHIRDAIAAFRTARKDKGLNAAIAESMLATTLEARGQRAEAKRLYKESIARQRAILGDRNPSITTSLGNLAGIFEAEQNLKEAEGLRREALDICRNSYGDKHLRTAQAEVSLGFLQFRQRRIQKGLGLMRQGLAHLRQAVGDDHVQVAKTQATLARALIMVGLHEEARQTSEEAVASAIKATGPHNALTLQARLCLGVSLGKLKQLQAAVDELATCYRLANEHAAWAKGLIQSIRREWIVCLLEMDREQEARELLQQHLAAAARGSSQARWAQQRLDAIDR